MNKFLTLCALTLTWTTLPALESAPLIVTADTSVELYFKNFEILSKSEKWKEILSQGSYALEAAKKVDRKQDEAKICAQLTSTAFYLGDYTQALKYANLCHELSEAFEDCSLFIRALYLESAVYRALAAKHAEEASYLRAVTIAEQALNLYFEKAVDNINLKGKIYFNLGAAHADNPNGDLEKAIECYSIALQCFKTADATDDILRASIRLGKAHLLQKNYTTTETIINNIRPLLSNERIAMQTDYLEAQLKLALDDTENAMKIAKDGLRRAKSLGAKEDELRLLSLIEYILSSKKI